MKQLPEIFPLTKRGTESYGLGFSSKLPDVEMIILFGSYAGGDGKEATDLDSKRPSGHVSDYDILVVTREKTT